MSRLEQFRTRRLLVYESLFTARALFIAGLVIMPALLFNSDTRLRILQFTFFWLLAWLSGKKNNPIVTILVFLGIVVFNLIIPYGQVLFSAGPFKITSGALAAGTGRAATVLGLLMLSRFTIRRDLKIPGLFGELIGESFRIFALVMSEKRRITARNFITDIDQLLLSLSANNADVSQPATISPAAAPAGRTRPAGFFLLAAVVLLSWVPWVASA
ncbi:MAG: hypothetical protein FWG99_08950 [Treponema sp.]|nr:hypothetical protein [Treponema sp.]